jgi:hypothetical protein
MDVDELAGLGYHSRTRSGICGEFLYRCCVNLRRQVVGTSNRRRRY